MENGENALEFCMKRVNSGIIQQRLTRGPFRCRWGIKIGITTYRYRHIDQVPFYIFFTKKKYMQKDKINKDLPIVSIHNRKSKNEQPAKATKATADSSPPLPYRLQ